MAYYKASALICGESNLKPIPKRKGSISLRDEDKKETSELKKNS